ncbi:hypothetical protein A2973_01525 [Candidatus Gottesmanbacteria bacterium RIFCSPLOWO2_01_FULL_49_10]|uniref:Queuosine 5'-phosphate N-glycosylase/hydrolase n=1 Tax=Candidatus Gottesmanbacteria bacterium RIFCSPLOWO2_01_FULL_49_10 TaxID=1798396 RepID=A0A1F6B2C8_9BACT|nr:MAG: hypothetical protein A2973_01525 [Candidatus Gottesmanbacteria bacterium RIFCSPLOWO2_01_FULL_49_10]
MVTNLDTHIARRLEEVPDPLGVRASTAWILGRANFVHLDPAGITRTAALVRAKIQNKNLLTQTQFGSRQIGPQLVFLQDVVNFCFWAPKGKPRWEVEYPVGIRQNGWYALAAVFERALAEGIPILDTAFLARLTREDTRHIFRGAGETPIPLLAKRQQFLKSGGEILSQTCLGSVDRFIDSVGRDAAKLARSIVTNFPSFEDSVTIDGRRITFYKRAQICVYDLSLLPRQRIQNLSALTAFADYKLPQLLRRLGAIHYTKPLERRVDSMKLIPQGSREEVEIRAATIWAAELVAQNLGIPAVVVDNALWLHATTTPQSAKPYHRTLTTCY